MQNTKKKDLRYLIELALLVAIMLMMNLTGLAMIPLPGQYASIMTVPVAVGAMMLGPLAGTILGTTMGCISFYTAVKTGFATMTMAGYSGATMIILTLVNTIVTRALMGLLHRPCIQGASEGRPDKDHLLLCGRHCGTAAQYPVLHDRTCGCFPERPQYCSSAGRGFAL